MGTRCGSISLTSPNATNGGSSNKFPIWNTNYKTTGGNTTAGQNDIRSISSTLSQTPDGGAPIAVSQTVGLTDADGIMAVFPTPAASVGVAGTPVTVLWVQKILNGDNTGSTALPVSEQCNPAPFSGKTNHDIATVRRATTTDGVHFTDLGPVNGLSDPTTVDYNKTRWVSPRGTLHRHLRQPDPLGLVLLGRQLPRRRFRRVPLHRIRRVAGRAKLDGIQRHQQPDRVDQPDHRRPTRRPA